MAKAEFILGSIGGILILILIITAGCVGGGSGEPTKTSPGELMREEEQQKVQEEAQEKGKCPIEFGVPSDLKIYATEDEDLPYILPSKELKRIDWKGWEYEEDIFSEEPAPMYCNFGSMSGENVNYLYCGASIGNEVSKRIIAEDGTVVSIKRYYLGFNFRPSGDGYVVDKMILKKNIFESPFCGVQYP